MTNRNYSIIDLTALIAGNVAELSGAQFAALDDIEKTWRQRVIGAICDGSLAAFMPDTYAPIDRSTPYTASFAVISLVTVDAANRWLERSGSPIRLSGSVSNRAILQADEIDGGMQADDIDGEAATIHPSKVPPAEECPTSAEVVELLGSFHRKSSEALREALHNCTEKKRPGLFPSKLKHDGENRWDIVGVLLWLQETLNVRDFQGAADIIAKRFPAVATRARAAAKNQSPAAGVEATRVANSVFHLATALDCGQQQV